MNYYIYIGLLIIGITSITKYSRFYLNKKCSHITKPKSESTDDILSEIGKKLTDEFRIEKINQLVERSKALLDQLLIVEEKINLSRFALEDLNFKKSQ